MESSWMSGLCHAWCGFTRSHWCIKRAACLMLCTQIVWEAFLKVLLPEYLYSKCAFRLFRVLNSDKRRPFNCTFDFTTASADTSVTSRHSSWRNYHNSKRMLLSWIILESNKDSGEKNRCIHLEQMQFLFNIGSQLLYEFHYYNF